VDRADNEAGGCRKRRLLVRLHQGAEAEVENLDLALLTQKQVRRFDIAVDDPSLMSMFQSQGGLGHVIDHFGRGK